MSAREAGAKPPSRPDDDRVERMVAAAPRIAFRAGVVVLGLVLAAWFLFQVSSVLVLAFISLILAAAIVGPVDWLEHRGVPGGLAVLAIYLVAALVLGVLVFLVAPPLLQQLTLLLGTLPATATSLLDDLQGLAAGLGLQADLSSVTATALDTLGGATSVLAALPMRLLGWVGDVLMILTLGAFMVLERRQARRWIGRFLAADERTVFVHLADQAALRLAAYVEAQLLIMAVTGIGATIGLTVIGVPFALALGTFAFLVQMVPVVGPFVGGAAMVLVALLQSPLQALATLVLVIALQQLTGTVLLPVVQGRLISISPVAAILAVLCGSALAGPIGAIVAVPAVAIVSLVVHDIVLPWRRGEIRRGPDGEEPGAGEPAAASSGPVRS